MMRDKWSRVEDPRGQVLVLFAIMIIVLLGMAALAIDVSGRYAELRYERAAADSSSLAGALDNYKDGSRNVDNEEWKRARTHAMQNLIDELDQSFVAGSSALPVCPAADGSGPVSPSPFYLKDIANCQLPGTAYYVSVMAPATTCQLPPVGIGGCDPIRSVQVTVRKPRHELSFARLFGQARWDLATTSIAERHLGTNYSFVTLRPPKPSRRNDPSCSPNCDANEDNIKLDGNGATLTVRGDMGTNTNMTLNAGATVTLDPGSFVDRYDAYKNWSGPPPDRQVSTPIPDPGYVIPSPPTGAAATALTYGDATAAHLSTAACTTEVGNIPAAYGVSAAGVATGEVVCLKPGRYTYAPGSGSAYSSVKTYVMTTFASTHPTYPNYGVYFFNAGFQPGTTTVIGGYRSASPGVAFVFPQSCGGGCTFAGNGVKLLALNAGTAYPGGGTSGAATAAFNWNGDRVETNTAVPLPMSLIVTRDPVCVVGPVEPSNSCSSGNAVLRLPGGGNLFVYFVQFAPTDNVAISGGSGSNGHLGQIWAWTVHYSGNFTNINLVGAQNVEPGVLRIATRCSPGEPCVNPEASAPLP